MVSQDDEPLDFHSHGETSHKTESENFIEDPNLKWMMNRGYPYFRKPPYGQTPRNRNIDIPLGFEGSWSGGRMVAFPPVVDEELLRKVGFFQCNHV